MNLILNINKPKEWSSFYVLKVLKKAFNEKKIGHIGTLDPMATGVLPIFAGKATKLISLFNGLDKTYRGTSKLGERRDTFDTEGKIISRKSIAHLTEKDIIDILPGWKGVQDQLAPIYSAVKHNGVPAYLLAREGNPAPRKKRSINIKSIEAEKIDLPFITMKVSCSAGTYIRTLVDDIGQVLGVGAYLTELERLSCGDFFLIQDAYDPEKILEILRDDGPIPEVNQLMLLSHLETINVNEKERSFLIQGQPLFFSSDSFQMKKNLSPCDFLGKAVDHKNQLIAIGRIVCYHDKYQFHPSKVLI